MFPGAGVSFPNFRRFYLQEGGFDFSVPAADLELSKFAINEEARNFPEEAVERLQKQRNRRSKRHIPGESFPCLEPSCFPIFWDVKSMRKISSRKYREKRGMTVTGLLQYGCI